MQLESVEATLSSLGIGKCKLLIRYVKFGLTLHHFRSSSLATNLEGGRLRM